MLIPTSMVIIFMSYLHRLTGSWTAWFTAQQTGWVREFTWPWQSFLNTIPAVLPGAYADHPWWAAVFRAEIVAMAVGVAVTVACVVLSIRAHRRGERPLWAEASWVGVQVLAFSLSYWFFSVTRATLLWFPLWIFLGRWVGRAPTRPDRRIASPRPGRVWRSGSRFCSCCGGAGCFSPAIGRADQTPNIGRRGLAGAGEPFALAGLPFTISSAARSS